MNFESVENDTNKPKKDNDGDRVLDMMKNMQQQAEETKPEQPPTVNSPETIHAHRKVDVSNYWEIKEIPSQYKLYPAGVKIEARPLEVIEVKKLASINEGNAEYVINDIIKRAVRITGMNSVDDLYLADKLYIVFWLRAVSFRDSSYVIDFNCPKCEKKSTYHFEVKNLDVNYLKDDYDIGTEIEMESGDIIKLRYLKLRDEFEMEQFIDTHKKLLGEIDADLLALGCMMYDINGKTTSTLAERYNYVLGLTAGDLSYLVTYTDEYKIGVEPVMNIECNECGGNVPMGVTFRGDFFLPKRKLR